MSVYKIKTESFLETQEVILTLKSKGYKYNINESDLTTGGYIIVKTHQKQFVVLHNLDMTEQIFSCIPYDLFLWLFKISNIRPNKNIFILVENEDDDKRLLNYFKYVYGLGSFIKIDNTPSFPYGLEKYPKNKTYVKVDFSAWELFYKDEISQNDIVFSSNIILDVIKDSRYMKLSPDSLLKINAFKEVIDEYPNLTIDELLNIDNN